jgi:hypothetical protein
MDRRFVQAISCVALVLMLSASAAYAQNYTGLVVNVPFAFHIGQAKLPAGEYVVKPVSTPSGKYFRIRSSDSTNMIMLMTLHRNTKLTGNDPSLVFSQYGSNYFLAQLLSPVDGINEALFKGNFEKELAANLSNKASLVVIAAYRR